MARYKIVRKKVKSVSISGNEDVYDLTTTKNHNFFANNILVHNCGEQPLTGYSCCNLSAINVYKFIKNEKMDWDELYNTAFNVMELMDNLIDVMEFPDERFKENAMKYRHVGIGPMGLADAMFELDLRYDSFKGKQFADKVMETITTACLHKSALLAKEYGKFFEYDKIKKDIEEIVFSYTDNEVVKELIKEHGLRNIQHTTCAPTGTTAISCDASYGIEPSFGLVYQKNLINGKKMYVVNPIFKKRFVNEEWYTETLIEKIFNNGGTLKNLRGIPKEVREVFVVAHDIKPKDRIDVQAALQKHCSSAISSTINLSEDTTKSEISELYKYAYKKELKGVTIYRDGSKKNQPVSFKSEDGVKLAVTKNGKLKVPSTIIAKRHSIQTGNGKLYTNVGLMNDKPIEVILNLGKGGQVMNTMTEAIGRLVSLVLQYNIPITEVVEQLEDLNSEKVVWSRIDESDTKPSQILSIPDGVAKVLDRYYGKNKPHFISSGKEKCERCGQPVMMIEGCTTCNCGYSKCG